jgi:hypothetical protein
LSQSPALDKIILTAIKLNRPIPKEMQSRPQVFPWLALFYNAFGDLVADRNWSDAPISWVARQRWADVHGLDRTATALLHIHVKAMDIAFLQWRREHAPKQPTPPKA